MRNLGLPDMICERLREQKLRHLSAFIANAAFRYLWSKFADSPNRPDDIDLIPPYKIKTNKSMGK